MRTPEAEVTATAPAVDPHPPREPRVLHPPTPPPDLAEESGRQDGTIGLKDEGLLDGNSAAALSIVQEQSLYLSPEGDINTTENAIHEEGNGETLEHISNHTGSGEAYLLAENGTPQSETHTAVDGDMTTAHSPKLASGTLEVPVPSSPDTEQSTHFNHEHQSERWKTVNHNRNAQLASDQTNVSTAMSDPLATTGRTEIYPDFTGPSGHEDHTASQTMSRAPFVSNPLFSHKRLYPLYPSSFLRPGSKFSGTQQSDQHIYNVDVEILTVSVPEASMTGYLRICGLTADHPTLTTFFTGEIIGGPTHKHTFQTKDPSWGANEKTDLHHWARFPAWRHLSRAAKEDINFKYPPPITGLGALAMRSETEGEGDEGPGSVVEHEHDSPGNPGWWTQPNVFMRWKEWFLVPDYRVRSIQGASFEGFYYICFHQAEGKINGIYFHSNSEKYQQLELGHKSDHGVCGAMEFR